MELLIVRHGETVANTKNLIQGQTHGSLTEKGEAQARLVARRLRRKKIDAIFSSDLKRARDTASTIAEYHETPVYHITWLRGRASGRYEGMRWEDVVAELGQERAFNNTRYRFGEGGESLLDMRKRMHAFVNAVKKINPDGTVVVCTHRHCVMILLSVIFDVPLKQVLAEMRNVKDAQIIENSGVVRILLGEGGARYTGGNATIKRIAALGRSHRRSQRALSLDSL